MKICVAQTRPVKGDIERNIQNHLKIIDFALNHGADTIIFPELSVTGYEPELAKELATHAGDSRFNDFQKISDDRQITIGIGMPTQSNTGLSISMVLFQPHLPRQTYSKKYLHPDEEAYFISGQNATGIIANHQKMALAICYEIAVPEHAENAFKRGAEIYVASVAKSVNGMENAIDRLAEIAKKYSLTVLMANYVGQCDNFICGGKTSVWNNTGLLLGQLDATNEGILIFDTATQEIIQKQL